MDWFWLIGGKSVIIIVLVVGLGGKVFVISRGSTIKGFIKTGKYNVEVEIYLRNRGLDVFKVFIYGDKIIVERKFIYDGLLFYKFKFKEGDLDKLIFIEME